jgi:hypothetical protein
VIRGHSKRRITGLFTLRRSSGSGYEKPQSALCAFVRFFSATFCPPCKCSAFAGRTVKTSHTAGTLCEMCAEIFVKIMPSAYGANNKDFVEKDLTIMEIVNKRNLIYRKWFIRSGV